MLRHTNGSWFYYPMNGKVYITGQHGFANLTANTSWQYAGIGDMNGDGKDDVMLRHTNGSWFYYPMNGKVYIVGLHGFANITANTSWQLAQIGDFGGDGKDDIMLRHATGSWFYFPMNGKTYIAGQHGFANLTSNTAWALP